MLEQRRHTTEYRRDKRVRHANGLTHQGCVFTVQDLREIEDRRGGLAMLAQSTQNTEHRRGETIRHANHAHHGSVFTVQDLRGDRIQEGGLGLQLPDI